MKRLGLLFLLAYTMTTLHADDITTPDFRYPQTVASNALKQLHGAQKRGDGEQTIDALVRYALAQSTITVDNAPTILRTVDDIRAAAAQPEVQAMLALLEAKIYATYAQQTWWQRHGRENPTDVLPTDIAEWDDNQFSARIDSLLLQAVERTEVLRAIDIDGYPIVIDAHSDSHNYLPTVLDFIMSEAMNIVTNEAVADSLRRTWLHAHDSDIAPTIYIRSLNIENPTEARRLYDEYSTMAESGLALQLVGARDENYAAMLDYVARFPHSRHVAAVRNLISSIEARRITVEGPSEVTTSDSIQLTIKSRNVADAEVIVYCVPDDLAESTRGNTLDEKRLTEVARRAVSFAGDIPFDSESTHLMLPPLPLGYYAIRTRLRADGKWKSSTIDRSDMFRVTDIKLFAVNDGPAARVLAVDSRSGRPLAGATIRLSRGEQEQATLTTDRQGLATYANADSLHSAYIQIRAALSDDVRATPISLRLQPTGSTDVGSATTEIFTDLAIYRPGETVRFTSITYRTTPTTRRTAPAGLRLRVELYDASMQNVYPDDTLWLTTDDHGQTTGQFIIPSDRLTGNYTIRITEAPDNDAAWTFGRTSHDITVSEYRTPTFRIDMADTRSSYDRGSDVTLRGSVTTYTGLPMAEAEVQLELKRNIWSWWWPSSGGDLIFSTTVTTDDAGHFSLTVPASQFPETPDDEHPWRCVFYAYSVAARATSVAGESHEATTRFTIGQRRGVVYQGGDDFIASRSVELPVSFVSSDVDETVATLRYELRPAADTSVVAARGTFVSDAPVLDCSRLPSGRYLLHVAVDGDGEADSIDRHIIIYRESDTASSAEAAMWIPESSRRVAHGQTHIVVGTRLPTVVQRDALDHETHIYYVARSRTAITSEGWLHYRPGLHVVALDMPDGIDEVLTIDFVCVAGGTVMHETVRLASPRVERLSMELTSFRDRLLPGTTEQWTLRLTDMDGASAASRIMLELYNQALHDLEPNTWQFAPTYAYVRPVTIKIPYVHTVWTSASWQAAWLNTSPIVPPHLNTYDRAFFDVRTVGGRARGRLMYAAATSSNAVMDMAAEVQDGLAADMDIAPLAASAKRVANGDIEEAEMEEADNTSGSQLEGMDIAIREGEVKVALWEPMLTTDDDGSVSLSFTTPEQNGTWRLQAVAYNKRLATAGLTRTLVTQRPVMVRPSPPRFLRSGDNATLVAVVENATDTTIVADTQIDVFDPRTGTVIVSQSRRIDIAPHGGTSVGITVVVPDTLPYLGLRIKAAASGVGDGEQQMVPVLPAVSPVVEATSFYLAPSDSTTTLRCAADVQAAVTEPSDATSVPLPAVPAGAEARFTLEVCANPIWMAALALPTIADGDYATTSAMAHNLYALGVAHRLAARSPHLRDAIGRLSVSQSPLSQNTDLKIGTLPESPWTDDALQQTARMARLSQLLDNEQSRQTLDDLVKRLATMQNADGGMAWYRYDGCRSSYWVTEEVLQTVGECIGDVDTEPTWSAESSAQLRSLTTRALEWYDSETVRQHEERLRHTKARDIDYTVYAPMVYIHTLYADHRPQGKARAIHDRCLKALATDWGRLPLVDRAYAAQTLHRNANDKAARAVAESLRQHALRDHHGMHWDGLQTGGYRWYAPVTLTSRVLQALAEVDPRTDELDDVRQWMLLEKQTTDWGNASLAADAVRSLLTLGSDWQAGRNVVAVDVDGETLAMPDGEAATGYSRVTLDAAPRAVTIRKTGDTPAWGALYVQYAAPATTVQAAHTDDVTIEKELYTYGADGELRRSPTFGVGDKVQVRIVVRTQRTLDYVTLVDERGACFEPVDQTTHYRWQDATCYLHETRDSETRFFIDRLSKGTHVLTYDVNVATAGSFYVGLATIQCQYAADKVAHSSGRSVVVNP